MRDWTGCEDTKPFLLTAACAGHEVRRAYALALDLPRDPSFHQLDERQIAQLVRSVALLLADKSTEDLHDLWVDEKKKHGWSYGANKDFDAKTDPWLVPYCQLPEQVKLMDTLFLRGATGALIQHGLVDFEE